MRSDDVVEIINVINLYALAVDARRWDLFDRVFTNDVQADFGGRIWCDLASLKRDFATIHTRFAATQHATTNHQVALFGDRANAISYVQGRFLRRDQQVGTADEAEGSMYETIGWYDDRLTRTVDGWRIEYRTCRRMGRTGKPFAMQPEGTEASPHQQMYSLHTEVDAGKVWFIAAISN